MNSREASGSASIPTRPRSPVTKPSISSRIVSMSLMSAGACEGADEVSGTPDVEPGV